MAKKDTAKPAKPAKEKPVKEKKGKDKKGKGAAAPAGGVPPTDAANGMPSAGTPSVPLSNLSPDQMTAAQLEQAIKESNDPNNKLKKLRSPINWRSCLINIAILIVATFAVVILWCYLVVDTFDFGKIMSDMFSKFGITQFFSNLGKTISGWFS
ncbi:MAG: hypothetical protein K2I75_03045 [Clostridiales bacterium]|nr:hypothetical protein [Clostridiales bacterium]